MSAGQRQQVDVRQLAMTLPLVLVHVYRLGRRRIGTRWMRTRERLFATAHGILVLFCLYWRIAGTTLAF